MALPHVAEEGEKYEKYRKSNTKRKGKLCIAIVLVGFVLILVYVYIRVSRLGDIDEVYIGSAGTNFFKQLTSKVVGKKGWSGYCADHPNALECAFYTFTLQTEGKLDNYPGYTFGEIKHCPPVNLQNIVQFRIDFYAKWFPIDICKRWMGVEIGPGFRPANIPTACLESRKFIDKWTSEQTKGFRSELRGFWVLEADIVDDATALDSIKDGVLDYVIANHVLEYLHDPIEAMANWIRVLRPGGRLYVSVLNKCNSVARTRVVTSWDHFVSEHGIVEKQAENQYEHTKEWAISDLYKDSWRGPISIPGPGGFQAGMDAMVAAGIYAQGGWHVHTFDAESWGTFLRNLNKHLAARKGESWAGFEVLEIAVHSVDLFAVLEKQ